MIRQQTDGILSLCMKVREQIIKDSTSGIKEKIKEYLQWDSKIQDQNWTIKCYIENLIKTLREKA